MAFAETLADALLDAGIIEFALTGRLARNQFVDGIANNSLGWSSAAIDGQNVGYLTRFEFADGGECGRISSAGWIPR